MSPSDVVCLKLLVAVIDLEISKSLLAATGRHAGESPASSPIDKGKSYKRNQYVIAFFAFFPQKMSIWSITARNEANWQAALVLAIAAECLPN